MVIETYTVDIPSPKESYNKRLEIIAELLKPLGVKPHQTLPGYFYHPCIAEVLDLRRCEPQGVICYIYEVGKAVGRNEAKREVGEAYSDFLGSFKI